MRGRGPPFLPFLGEGPGEWAGRVCRANDLNMARADAQAVALLLAGPTGVGKSAVALELAQRHSGEIISVDSMQVYRGMDIGTAKPSPADRKLVPHHLLDILHLNQTFDV